MDDYKPNSNRFKEGRTSEPAPEKKIERVTTGVVKVKKKGELQKFTDIFISEDAKSVKSFVIMDVLVPSIKKAISDIVTNGIDIVLYGEAGRSRRSSSSPGVPASRVSYDSRYYDSRSSRPVPARTASYDYNDVIFTTRGEAEEVLARMDDLIATYKIVSVADFYDLAGITGNYTDNKYGWFDLRDVRPDRVRDGYILRLPKALPLN